MIAPVEPDNDAIITIEPNMRIRELLGNIIIKANNLVKLFNIKYIIR